MSTAHQLNASTPFLRGIPNSQVSPEWYRLLASIVQIIYPNSQHIVDLSGFEDFSLGELPVLQDPSISSINKSIDAAFALLHTTNSDEGNARGTDLIALQSEVAPILQESVDALYRALKLVQDTAIDQLMSQDVIRSMAYQDSSNVNITGGSASLSSVTSTSYQINQAAVADQSYSYQTPTTGFSITIASGVQTLILDPSGTLASGTITMPASPVDGQIVRINSTQNITALAISGNTGQTVKNSPTAFSVNLTGDQGYKFLYRLSTKTWYRLQ